MYWQWKIREMSSCSRTIVPHFSLQPIVIASRDSCDASLLSDLTNEGIIRGNRKCISMQTKTDVWGTHDHWHILTPHTQFQKTYILFFVQWIHNYDHTYNSSPYTADWLLRVIRLVSTLITTLHLLGVALPVSSVMTSSEFWIQWLALRFTSLNVPF